jgi:hypothetical protein
MLNTLFDLLCALGGMVIAAFGVVMIGIYLLAITRWPKWLAKRVLGGD